ncbi:DinB family protein [bacterium]|nr:DinB family protein [bacterium]
MNPRRLAPLIRLRFALTSRSRAAAGIARDAARYESLAADLSAGAGARPIFVPAMVGVDEDMRRWSYWMLLAHNAIVNRGITAVTVALAEGREPDGAALIDPKRDVLPGPEVGPEQLDVFRDSVAGHLAAVAGLDRLRGTATRPHPLFGDFDAHKWHCMFGFHLKVHMKQAHLVARGAREARPD